MADMLRDKMLRYMELRGLSRRALSLNAGLSEGAVKAILSGHSKHPRYDTLEKLAIVLGCTVSDLIEDERGIDEATSTPLTVVAVSGHVQAGSWVEALEWPHGDWFEIAVLPDRRYPGVPRFGLLVRGPSMDLVYPDGTILICVALADPGRTAKSGERIICQRRRGRGEFEITVKEYVVRDDNHWLVPHSTDPRYQSPTALDPGDAEDISLVALVIGSYRPE